MSIFLLSTMYIISYSQNIQVIYHTDYTRNAARPKTKGSEQTKLVIGEKSSEFYSPFRARIDSLLNSPAVVKSLARSVSRA